MNTFLNRKALALIADAKQYFSKKLTKDSQEIIKENEELIMNLLFINNFEQITTEQSIEIYSRISTRFQNEMQKRQKKFEQEVIRINNFRLEYSKNNL